jgi:hypothetical protein
MKQKILFALLAVVCLVGCGGSDEEEQSLLESFYSNVAFAGVWNVSEVNIGGTWQGAKAVGYKDSQIIIAEDSCYQSFGRFGNSYGRYVIKDGKAQCLDYYRKLRMVCHFKRISGNNATATITNKDGVSLDFRLLRDDSNPAIYLDPLKYLDGTWDIREADGGGYIELHGYAAVVHHSQFDAGWYIDRHPSGISRLLFGEQMAGYFDLSKEPYTLHLQGRCYELGDRNITFDCIKRSE